jgi:hypothetical protein
MVSNEAGQPLKRAFRPLSDDQWRLARIQFETGDKAITHKTIALAFNTSVSSVSKRSASEKWAKQRNLALQIANGLKSETDRLVQIETEKAGQQIVRSVIKDLQPFIEREKRDQIKRAIKRSKLAQKRLSKVADGYQVYDSKSGQLVNVECAPKDEMHIASAEEKYDSIIRRNLGMDDGKAPAGSVNLNILTGQAAVQVNAPADSHPGA